jgi:hypothetical protein
MRIPTLAALLLFATPLSAQAQLVAPLATSDGKVACTQGMTGVGRTQVWEAVADKRGLGGYALAETAGDPTDLRFPLCVCTEIVALDLDASLRLTIVSGTHEQAGGLMFRAQNANDYYVARVSALDGGSVKLYRMAGGRRAELGAKTVAVKTGEPLTLRVLAKQEQIEIFLNGNSVLKLTDRSLIAPGPVGVWSQSDSIVHFDSLLVAPATIPPAPK